MTDKQIQDIKEKLQAMRDEKANMPDLFGGDPMGRIRAKGFIEGHGSATDFLLPKLVEAIGLLEMKKWHDDDCEDQKEKFNEGENCECGAAGIKMFLNRIMEGIK